MTDESIPDRGPLFEPEAAPQHGAAFWHRLESELAAGPVLNTTRSMPAASVGPVASTSSGDPADLSRPAFVDPVTEPPGRRFGLPLAVAAAVLVLVGLGVAAAVRLGGDEGSRTEIVAGPTEVADPTDSADPADTADSADPQVGAADGPADGTGDAMPEPTPVPDPTAGQGITPAPDPTAAQGGTAAPGPTAEPQPTAEPEPTPVPEIPDFPHAFGAQGEPDHLPLDQGLPADGTYLNNWPERSLTYYATSDDSLTCANAKYGEIRYVNASGLTLPVRDPQLRFSGEVSHMIVNSDENLAAWVVSCGTQLELFVGELDDTGRVDDLTLAWFGDGAVDSALVLWDGTEVSLNAIEPATSAFSVVYDVETGLLSRNGGPSRIMLEAGAPAERSLTPLAATGDAGLTYWAGKADPGTVSACAELFGSGESDMLWLRQGEGIWLPAVAGDFPIATVTAAAIEPEFLQFAFADVCPNQAGRVVVGTQLPDGRIGDPIELDLTPYVPGHVKNLFWVDPDTLRIETDNSGYGFGIVRFDFRLDERIVVQLD